MSRYVEISRLPTIIKEIPEGSIGVHESVLRAYHILEEVKGMLESKVPHEFILEFIKIMEGK